MYHSISCEQDEHQLLPYFETNTFPSIFEKHVQFLSNNKYKAVALDDFLDEDAQSSEDKRVVITFDDGYRDFYTGAFPILAKYGMSATMFLPTGYIGMPRSIFSPKPFLDIPQIKELSDYGIIFGSHSHYHAKLTDTPPDELVRELETSKEIIQQITGRPVNAFSYPYAFPETKKDFVRWLRRILAELDFKAGVTTRIGLNRHGCDSLTLKRIPMNSYDDASLFAAKLEGAYDWMNNMQLIVKNCKELMHRISVP